ncbi:uncharacterized protein LOC117592661 [Drosophila guanche]|uniref:Odorant-binding protein 56c n=1 Tax=Drosophila guanche TaxID=7266 RepID=A0A3B0J6N4_DROGU|nr:uncharacterized protein LOC117592661 [Drosophila guanche]SPP75492.1 Hypothetical predicted protein [Drosophila guanche]
MLFRDQILFLLCLGLSELLPLTWSRTLTVSLNMSMTRSVDEEEQNAAKGSLSEDMMQSCIRRTEISMSQLKLFHMSLLNNDYTSDNDVAAPIAPGENNLPDGDYGISSQMPYLDLKGNEPLQCFVSCLYESLDVHRYNILLEQAFRQQVQNMLQKEKPAVKECGDLQGRTRCEAAYKLHLCYNHLKTMETEQRIRDIIERSEMAEGNEGLDSEKEPDGDIIDGTQHSNEVHSKEE